MTLAVLLEWPALKHRTLYRTLLFLPYAVPGFISILVFKGLFNQNFGEINAILDALFGVRPAWFADPTAGQGDAADRQHLARLPLHHDPVHRAAEGRARGPLRSQRAGRRLAAGSTSAASPCR
jgi:hypothetical protein